MNNNNNNNNYDQNNDHKYQQPNTNNQPQNNNYNQGVAQNQGPSNTVVLDYSIFKTNSVVVTCPACKSSEVTTVNLSFSCSNYLCYYCFPCCWICYQACRGKAISCNDAVHNCGKCGNRIANYTAC